MHLYRFKTYGDPLVYQRQRSKLIYPIGQMPEICTKEDCNEPTKAKGLCVKHYGEQYRWGEVGPPLRFEMCPVCRHRQYRLSLDRGMCAVCFRRGDARKGRKMQHQNGHWDRDTCLAAGAAWYELTGYAPRSTHWNGIGLYSNFPSANTIYTVFDSWSGFINELGLPLAPKAQLGRPPITLAECLSAGMAFVSNYGFIPSIPEWYAAGMSPSHCTVYDRCGSWVAFKLALADATGLDPGYLRNGKGQP